MHISIFILNKAKDNELSIVVSESYDGTVVELIESKYVKKRLQFFLLSYFYKHLLSSSHGKG